MKTTPAGRPLWPGGPKPLAIDDPIEWWNEDAKRLGVESGQVLREQVRLADQIIEEILAEEAAVY